jgi:O-antigen ligase
MQAFRRVARQCTELLPLLALSATVAILAFYHGGVDSAALPSASIVLGAFGAVFFAVTPRSVLAPAMNRWMACGWIGLLGYAALQLMPLPLELIGVLSPAKRELVQSVETIAAPLGLSPLTVSAQATFQHVNRLFLYLLIFLLAREVAWRSERNAMVTILPLVLIALVEAAIGVSQYLLSHSISPATGTYVNRNHFAGFLQMLLPFAVVRCCEIGRRSEGFANALLLCLWFAAAGLLLTGIVFSLSRAAAVSALISSALVIILLTRVSGRHVSAAIPLIAAALMLLSPMPLITRFTELVATDTSATRMDIWTNSLDVISGSPLFGCGVGAFGAAFEPYKTVIPDKTVEFVHNDYLQLLAELGLIGIIPLLLLALSVGRDAVGSALRHRGEVQRGFAVACVGSLCSMSLSSFVDFHLYIPANAAVLAWIAGIAVMATHFQPPPNALRPVRSRSSNECATCLTSSGTYAGTHG